MPRAEAVSKQMLNSSKPLEGFRDPEAVFATMPSSLSLGCVETLNISRTRRRYRQGKASRAEACRYASHLLFVLTLNTSLLPGRVTRSLQSIRRTAVAVPAVPAPRPGSEGASDQPTNQPSRRTARYQLFTSRLGSFKNSFR